MTLIRLKGYEFKALSIRDSFNRRALKYKNNIIRDLRTIGLTEDDVYLDIEPVAIKRVPAVVSWYVDGYHLHYSYKSCTKYVENLYVVSKLIELEINAIVKGEKTLNQFIFDFTEEKDVEDERKAARDFLGVDSDTLDLDIINKKYKLLAKEAHPDMPTGDTERFKELNRAHKILTRELA